MDIDAKKTAVIVVDMWDTHYCKSFVEQYGRLVDRLSPALWMFRAHGIPIVFMNADVLPAHRGEMGERLLASYATGRELKKITPKEHPGKPSTWAGCSCEEERCKLATHSDRTWTRIHPGIDRRPYDLVGDWNMHLNFLWANEIETLLYAGGATNICVLDARSFSVCQSIGYGFKTVLLEDLTEPLLPGGSKRLPEVIAFYREHICPVVKSSDLTINGYGDWPNKITGDTTWQEVGNDDQ